MTSYVKIFCVCKEKCVSGLAWRISWSSQKLFSFAAGDVFEKPRLVFKGLHLIQVTHRDITLLSCFDVFDQSPAFELPVINQLQ